jgi:hypothetical protein
LEIARPIASYTGWGFVFSRLAIGARAQRLLGL